MRRPKADPANPCHVSAPMPGVVASIAVASGRPVVAGDRHCGGERAPSMERRRPSLMTIEAMKMEAALHAEPAGSDGTVAALHVAAGQSVEAKDLLLEYAEA